MKQQIKLLLMCLTITLLSGADAQPQIAGGGVYTLKQTAIAAGGGQNSAGGQFTLDGTIGQFVAGQQTVSSAFIVGSGFWNPPAHTMVSVGGRLITSAGRGIRNGRVFITGPNGTSLTMVTGPLGFFRFDNIEIRNTYTLSVMTRRFLFAQPTQMINPADNVSDILFTALP